MANGTDGLTFEQIVQLINEVRPDTFYQRAEVFDRAARRVQDVLDQVRAQQNRIQEAMTGRTSQELDDVAREVAAKISLLLSVLQNPGYGAMLRKAGDALAAHQRRIADLQAQKAQQDSAPPVEGGPSRDQIAQSQNQAAQQVLRDLSTAYQDITGTLTPLPYNDPRVIGGGGGGVVNGGGGQGAPPPGSGTGGGHGDGSVLTDLPGGVLKAAFGNGGPESPGSAFLLPGGNGGVNPFTQVLGKSDGGESLFPGMAGPLGIVGGGAGTAGGSGGGMPGYGMPIVGGGVVTGGSDVLNRRERSTSGSPIAAIPGVTGGVLGKKDERKPQRKVAAPDNAPVPPPLSQVETVSAGLVTAAQALDAIKTTSGTPNLPPPVPQTSGQTVSATGQVVNPNSMPPGNPPPGSPPPGSPPPGSPPSGNPPQLPGSVPPPGPGSANPPGSVPPGSVPPGSVPPGSVTPPGTTPPGSVTPPATPPGSVPPPGPGNTGNPPVSHGAFGNHPTPYRAPGGDASTGGLTPPPGPIDPERRGMALPGSGTLAGIGRGPGEIPNPATVRGMVEPMPAGMQSGGSSMGGFPMSPMMMGGMGMGAQGGQQNSRMAAVPSEHRPEFEDPPVDDMGTLGRRASVPAPEEPEPDFAAHLEEQLAELDRLMERGK
ncbi:hypothetical protein [Amycolatopsis jejuensis]|uniref:hypothetical protein n=1 Tax=Amycolatopsis jejuensis TaxID=330084 RepID=UPI0005243E54|nr:hypothetical protein [Amycolatopsis jejuensis]